MTPEKFVASQIEKSDQLVSKIKAPEDLALIDEWETETRAGLESYGTEWAELFGADTLAQPSGPDMPNAPIVTVEGGLLFLEANTNRLRVLIDIPVVEDVATKLAAASK